MLSVCTLKSAAQARTYFEQGDYYLEGGVQNEWFGEGAKKLNLTGEISFEEFERVLSGKLPGGIQMMPGFDKEGETKHRPGYDLTFSAPKSVSILALVGGDKRLIEAHKKSVMATLSHIEDRFLATRMKKDGEISVEKTGNMVAGMHVHWDSREGDPNLHTHCTVANITDHKGKWRAIYGDDFYSEKMNLGFYYRNELAQELHKIGYGYNVLGRDGLIETKGFSDKELALFSKRREQIKDKLGTMHSNSASAASLANLLTRKTKQPTSNKDALPNWEREWADAGFEVGKLHKLIEKSITNPYKALTSKEIAEKSVALAIGSNAEQHAVFSIAETFRVAKRFSAGYEIPEKLYVDALKGTFDARKAVYVGEHWITTEKAQLTEKYLIHSLKKDQHWYLSNFNTGLATRFCFQDKNQRAIAQSLLQEKNRVCVVTSSNRRETAVFFKKFQTLPKDSAFIHHICPNKAISKQFESFSGIKSKNLYHFLEYTDKLVHERAGAFFQSIVKNVWVIHHAQIMGTEMMQHLVDNAKSLNAKIQLVHYEHEKSGFRPGKPSQYLQKSVPTYFLKEGSTFDLKAALEKKIDTLVEKGSFVYEQEIKAHINYAVNWLLAEKKEALQKSSVYMTSQSQVNEVNTKVRVALMEKGVLERQTVTIAQLRSVHLSEQEKIGAGNYNTGEFIVFSRNFDKKTFLKGEQWSIAEVNLEKNALKLSQGEKVETLSLAASKVAGFQVFREGSIDLAKGDRVVWKTPVGTLSAPLKNNAFTEVVAVCHENKTLSLKKETGTVVEASFKEPIPLFYGYAQTILQSPKTGIEKGLLVFNSKNIGLVDGRDFITAVSQLKTTRVITDDVVQLKTALLQNSGCAPHAHTLKRKKFNATALLGAEKTSLPRPFEREIKFLKDIVKGPVEQVGPIKNSIKAITSTESFLKACRQIEQSLKVLTERECVFTEKTLQGSAKTIGISLEESENAFKMALQEKVVLKIGADQRGEPLYALRSFIEMEKTCVAINKRGVGQVEAILDENSSEIEKIKAHKTLTSGQKDAVLHILTSQDRFIAVHGAPGVGKTTLLKAVKSLGREAGANFLGLTNTAAAKENLFDKTGGKHDVFKEAGITSKTVAKFLIDGAHLVRESPEHAKKLYENTVIFIDEASMLSTRESFELKTLVEQLGARSASLGDTKQQGSIDAGKQFHVELAEGIPLSVVSTIVRLQDKMALERVQDLYRGDIKSAFKNLQNSMLEIPIKEERLKFMASMYVSNTPENTMAIMPLNVDRKAFNEEVRTLYKEQGVLTGKELLCKALLPRDISQNAKTCALAYEKGDFVRFSNTIDRLGIEKGDHCLVRGVENTNVILENRLGKTVTWTPAAHFASGIEVYRAEDILLAKGDVIRWRRNDEERGLINSHTAEILKVDINSHTAEVRCQHGENLNLKLMEEVEKPIRKLEFGDFIVLPNQDPTKSHDKRVGIFQSYETTKVGYKVEYTTKESDSSFTEVLNSKDNVIVLKGNWPDCYLDHNYGLTSFSAQGLDKKNTLANLEGISPRVLRADQVRRDTTIIIPETSENSSKIGKFKSVNFDKGNCEITAITRESEKVTFNLESTEDAKGNKNHLLSTYSDIDCNTKHPPFTNLESLLVMASRGDNFILLVDNQDTVKAALQANLDLLKTPAQLQADWAEKNNVLEEKIGLVDGVAKETETYRAQKAFNEKYIKGRNLMGAEARINSVSYAQTPNEVIATKSGISTQKKLKIFDSGKEDPIRREINARLNQDIQGFVSSFLDNPVSRSGTSAQWAIGHNRKKPNLSVELSGSKSGYWYDFRSGKGGRDLFSFYLEMTGESYKQARDFLGPNLSGKLYRSSQKSITPSDKKLKDDEAHKKMQSSKIQATQKLYKQGQPIAGTLAEKYLRDHRQIKGALPKDFKFDPKCYHYQLKKNVPALLVPARGAHGEIKALNRIFLGSSGQKLKASYKNEFGELLEASAKLAKGVAKGATIDIQKGKEPSTCYLSEGTENALCIKEVNADNDIKACLSINNLDKITLNQNTKTVIIVADNDGVNLQTKGKLIKTVKHYLEKGLEVKIALPLDEQGRKIDLNDILKKQGRDGVSSVLKDAITINDANDLGSKNESLQSSLTSIKNEKQLEPQKTDIKQHNRIKESVIDIER